MSAAKKDSQLILLIIRTLNAGENIWNCRGQHVLAFSCLPCNKKVLIFFCGPDSTSLYMQNNIPACFLEVPNACVKLALIKPQSLFWENTVHIVGFNNRLNYRPAAVLQTKLTDITSLLDSGSQNSIDLHQWCIDTGYGRALEKLKSSLTLISSEWLH